MFWQNMNWQEAKYECRIYLKNAHDKHSLKLSVEQKQDSNYT